MFMLRTFPLFMTSFPVELTLTKSGATLALITGSPSVRFDGYP